MFLLTLSTPVRKRFDLFTTLLKTKINRYTYTFQYSSRYSTFVKVAAKKHFNIFMKITYGGPSFKGT